MNIQNIRLSRGWTQQQLADMSGVSCRTIQRIERGGNASLESMKCLAAVFEIDFNQLQDDNEMTINNTEFLEGTENDNMNDAIERVTEIKWFYIHIAVYMGSLAVIGMSKILNLISSEGFIYTTTLWTFILALHAIYVMLKPAIFRMIDRWEHKQISRRIKK